MKGQLIRGLTSADRIAGITHANDDDIHLVNDVILKITAGGIKPQKEKRDQTIESYGEDGWATKLGKFWSISTSRAKELINIMKDDQSIGEEGYLGVAGSLVKAINSNVHVVGGEEIRLQIINPGIWGMYEQILKYVDDETALSPSQLYEALNNGKKALDGTVDNNGKKIILPGPFALRRFLFVHVASSRPVKHLPGDHIDIEVSGVIASPEPYECYDIATELDIFHKSTIRIKLPPSASEAFTIDQAKELVFECIDLLLTKNYMYTTIDEQKLSLLDGLESKTAKKQADIVFNTLKRKTIAAGALKSLLQKSIRYGSKETSLPNGTLIDTRIVIMVTISMLYSVKSSFVPDLGTHVRGCTAASKRLAVIMVEDSWPSKGLIRGIKRLTGKNQNPGDVLSALMGVALATSKIPEYEPSKEIIISSLLIGVACHQSSNIIDWRPISQKVKQIRQRKDIKDVHLNIENIFSDYKILENLIPNIKFSGAEFEKTNKSAVTTAARVLRIVRSFTGDMEMMD